MDEFDVTLECDMNATACLKGEGILSSGDYGPCTIICAYDSDSQKADMFHYVMPSDVIVESFLEKVIQDSSHENNVHLYVRGCGLSVVPENLQQQSDKNAYHKRESIASFVQAYFPNKEQVDVQWSGRDTRGTCYVNAATGEFYTDEKLPSEYRLDLDEDVEDVEDVDYDCFFHNLENSSQA